MKEFLIFLLFIAYHDISAQDLDYVKAKAMQLSAPEMSGRGYVDNGVERAADFIAEEFEDIGLVALSDEYRQGFEHDVNTFPKKVSISIEGKALRPGADFLVAPDSPSIKGKRRAVVIKGSDLFDESGRPNEFLGLCHDCVLVIDMAGIDSKETRATAIQFREQYRSKHPVMWSSDDKFTWSVGTIQFPYPLIEIRSGMVKDGDFITFDICAKLKQDFKSENVVGMVEGTAYPDSFIVFTAHYDHLGMMGKEATFYGANDNASGTAFMLSLAKHFAVHPVEYSTVFIAFAGEEAGLVGSKFFVEHPLIDIERIRFLINMDLMGSGIDGITVVNAPAVKREFDLMLNINEVNSYIPKIKSRKQTANSDHYYFAEQGVPAVFIYALGGSTAYHDIYDVSANLTFDEYVDIFRLLTDLVAKL